MPNTPTQDLAAAIAALEPADRRAYDRLEAGFMIPSFTPGPVRWRIYDPDGERHAVPEPEWPMQDADAPWEPFGIWSGQPEHLWGFMLDAPGYLDTTGWHIGSATAAETLAELLSTFADDGGEEE